LNCKSSGNACWAGQAELSEQSSGIGSTTDLFLQHVQRVKIKLKGHTQHNICYTLGVWLLFDDKKYTNLVECYIHDCSSLLGNADVQMK